MPPLSSENEYDVCIIGSGPAGLAVLSSIQEEYSIDMLSDIQVNRASKWMQKNGRSKKRVCVIDPNPQFLHQWEKNFGTLDISFLRSPAVAHCCYFDKNALLAFALSEGRESELIESGCSEIRSLQGTVLPQIGGWKLPSTKLFIDFSRSMAKNLKHDYCQGYVTDIQKKVSNDGGERFELCFRGAGNEKNATPTGIDHRIISSKSVILATGAVGRRIVPKSLQNEQAPSSRVFQWQELDKALSILANNSNGNSNSDESDVKKQRILVIGGGLTAVQTAHKIIGRFGREGSKAKAEVLLCSRKSLVERHFDIPTKWFDYRISDFHQSQFYHEHKEKRLAALRQNRGGGTVPPLYMNITRALENKNKLIRKVGEVSILKENEDKSLSLWIVSEGDETDSNANDCRRDRKEEMLEVDAIILACGIESDCLSHPLVQKIHDQWPVEIHGGYPVLSEDLSWTGCDNLCVVGGLASLSVGPDAANLMGISRAAETVANTLRERDSLRDQQSGVYKNRYDMFMDDSDTDSDTESDSDSDTDDSR